MDVLDIWVNWVTTDSAAQFLGQQGLQVSRRGGEKLEIVHGIDLHEEGNMIQHRRPAHNRAGAAACPSDGRWDIVMARH